MKKKNKEYQLLMYVENSCPRIKKFDTKKQMGQFVESFQKQYPDHMAMESGYWIDYCIFGVTGEVCFFTDGLEVE